MDTPLPRVQKRMTGSEHKTSPPPRGFRGNKDQTGGVYSCGAYDPDFLGPPNPIDQLVAALCHAGLNTNPKCQRCHGLDPHSDE